jgi:enoyl-CoA hydratase/carnithine racemase
MTERAVCYDVIDGITWLTINRPEGRNALNQTVRDGLFAGIRRINADRAERIGLVNRVVPDGELREQVQVLARRIAAKAPLSVLAAKKTVRLVAEHPPSAAFEEAERIWEPVYTSQDAQEGPSAFRDTRAPEWKGR